MDNINWKINPVRYALRTCGFDPSTLGREMIASSPFGCGLLKSEKAIIVLTLQQMFKLYKICVSFMVIFAYNVLRLHIWEI
jgi:hypothetical protein